MHAVQPRPGVAGLAAIAAVLTVFVAGPVRPDARGTDGIGARGHLPPAGAAATPPLSATPAPGVPGSAPYVPGGTPSPTPTGAGARIADPLDPCGLGRNEGATDRGVTAGDIRLFANVTSTGGSPMDRDVERAMRAVLHRTNDAGGVCGRALKLKVGDDGGTPSGGYRDLQEAIEGDKVFAVLLPHWSEGARVAEGRYFDATRTPVLTAAHPGLDRSDWISVAGADDATIARAMVRDAYARGARDFAVVFDDLRTGTAFDEEVFRLTGRHVTGWRRASRECTAHWCGPERDATSPRGLYEDMPDFVALLTGPHEGLRWMRGVLTPGASDTRVRYGHAAPGAMLATSLREACGAPCDGLRVWSPLKAPCGYAGDAALRRFARDLPGADPYDLTVVGAYAAAEMLVEGVQRLGPSPTRAGLRDSFRGRVSDLLAGRGAPTQYVAHRDRCALA